MIAARAGIVAPDVEQSAAYVGGWLRALRNDKKLVVSAASRAQRAADRVLGRQDNPTEEHEPGSNCPASDS
jgi:antirestriction protein ArdC